MVVLKKRKKQLFFLLYSMSVGGVEKAFLGLLSTITPEKYEVHVGFLQRKGGFLDLLPQWVIVHECFCGVWDIVNQPPLVMVKSFIKQGHFFEAFVHLFLYIIYKATGDRTAFYRFVLRNDPKIDIIFDEAYAYAGPSSMLDFYVCRKINAKKRYGWVHFDILKNGIDKIITRRLYKNYETIYVVSETAKQHFDSVFPEFKERTQVRYNIIPVDKIHLYAEFAPTFTDEFLGKRILTVGRMSKEKGQDVTIQALKILLEEGYNIKWYYVGDGNLRKQCERLAEEHGVKDCVAFLGTQTNPYGYMRDCDIYVQPSRHEGYCITLAEARCFTAPIVATNFTGAEEQLKTYPQSIVTGMDAEDIADGIMHFL